MKKRQENVAHYINAYIYYVHMKLLGMACVYCVYVLQVAIESLKTMRFSPTAPYSIYFHFAMRLSILLCVSVGIKRTSCEVESCAIIVK